MIAFLKRSNTALVPSITIVLLASTSGVFAINQALESERQLNCLAMNVYQEARGETADGQRAVATVTLNRVSSKHYPNTLCEVVWQPVQFSWTSLKPKYHQATNLEAWDSAYTIASQTLSGKTLKSLDEATHYHTVDVSPDWQDKTALVAQVGKHLFYDL